MSASAHNLLMTSRGRVFLVAIVLVAIASVAGFGHLYGQHLAYGDMRDRDSAFRQLETRSQQLELVRKDHDTEVSALQTEVDRLQARLNSIIPSKNRYDINPNQSLLVADGHLAIGLVGGPSTYGINININGKQQFAVVGDVIHVAPDSSTACDVKIQSFDMFKAQFTASCGPSKTE